MHVVPRVVNVEGVGLGEPSVERTACHKAPWQLCNRKGVDVLGDLFCQGVEIADF